MKWTLPLSAVARRYGLENDLKTVAGARVSLGAVAPTPLLVEDSRSCLVRSPVFARKR